MAAAPRHDQDLGRAPDLLLADPALAAFNRLARCRKRFPQVERARRAEAQLVQRARHAYAAASSVSAVAATSGLAEHVSLHANRRAHPLQPRRIVSGYRARPTRW